MYVLWLFCFLLTDHMDVYVSFYNLFYCIRGIMSLHRNEHQPFLSVRPQKWHSLMFVARCLCSKDCKKTEWNEQKEKKGEYVILQRASRIKGGQGPGNWNGSDAGQSLRRTFTFYIISQSAVGQTECLNSMTPCISTFIRRGSAAFFSLFKRKKKSFRFPFCRFPHIHSYQTFSELHFFGWPLKMINFSELCAALLSYSIFHSIVNVNA